MKASRSALTLILMRGREAVPRKVDDDWQSCFE
jgi:hypothetical protein